MHDFIYLQELLIILGFAIVVLFIFNRLKLPAIAGFILTGILLGPHAFKVINDAKHVELLAEIGVALLLFGIGSELSLSKLKRLWKLIVLGGLLQVGITSIITFLICRFFGLSDNQAVFIGIVLALSSTAIVLRGLQQRGEVDAPHGRLILGILIFQDFAVVPAMMILPLLVDRELDVSSFALTFLNSIAIIAIILFLALLIVPKLLKVIARTRQRQLFILSVFVICLGTAWLVTKSGASLAIGAFLAGLVVSGSEYRHQAISDMIPFREIFAGLFFVSIGMLLSPNLIFNNWAIVLLVLFFIILGKTLIVFLTAFFMRMPLRACVIAGLALAQVGEFSFILLNSVKGTNLISSSLENTLISSAILSMFLTPFVMSFGPKLAAGIGKFKVYTKMMKINTVSNAHAEICNLCDHIIIAGYGFAGRELSLALKYHQIPFVVVDLNSQNIKNASEETGSALFGDITSEQVLERLGIDKALELVILINDTTASEHAVRVARNIAPDLHISVRIPYLLDVDSLIDAGANEVISSEQEAAVQVSSQVLKRNNVNSSEILNRLSIIRSNTEEDDV
ncbi:MAG: cation:proton antiporter [Candidatus Zixiibacteriota bacterium]